MAIQTFGEGPDLLLMSGAGPWNLDVLWEHPAFVRFATQLGSFARVTAYMPRGYGLSDPLTLGAPPAAEEWVNDIRWVLDAVGAERMASLSAGEAGAFDLLMAASNPEQIHSLVQVDTSARLARDSDYPFGFRASALSAMSEWILSVWGTAELIDAQAPEVASDPRTREWWARCERGTMSPGTLAFIRRMLDTLDIRAVLPLVQARTLVISHTDNTFIGPAHGRFLAEHLPNAEFVERPGFCGVPWLHDTAWLLEKVESFLTGARRSVPLDDRYLATVLFTDIVDSTARSASLGDNRWRQLLDSHDDVVRAEISRFRGRFVKSTGDGVLATFDGPGRAIRCGESIRDALRGLGIDVRVGLHTGEVVDRGDDVGGLAVAIAARVVAHAEAGQVLVSGSVPPLMAGSDFTFSDRGVHELKGVPGEWRLYAASAHVPR